MTSKRSPEPRSDRDTPTKKAANGHNGGAPGNVVRFAMVGPGEVGEVLLEALRVHPNANVTYIVCANPSKHEAKAALCGAKVTTSLDEALDSGDVDAVVIATPTPQHEEQLLACIARGKPVLVEKPCCMDLPSTERVVKAAEDANVMLMVAFQRRFDRHFQDLKAKVDANVVGEHIEMIKLTARDPLSPGGGEPPEGRVWNSMIHDIDMACWLMDAEPSSAYCTNTSVHNLAAVLTFPSGALCTIEWNNTIRYGYDQRAEVHGPNGMIQVGNPQRTTTAVSTAQGQDQAQFYNHFLTRYPEAYAAEVHAFVAAVAAGAKESPVPLQHILRTARAAAACQASLTAAHADALKSAKPDIVAANAAKALATPLSGPKVRVCLVGAGRMGSIRAGKIAAEARFELAWVMDVDGAAAERLAAEHGAQHTTKLADALADDTVTAVWISVSTPYHMAVIREAAAAGKHMYCEKPISLSVNEVDEAFAAASAAGVILTCGWNRRYDPQFYGVYEACYSGDAPMGAPQTLTVHNGDHPLPPVHILKTLGSIYHDFMVHDVDHAVWMMGQFPATLYATGTTFSDELRAENVLDSGVVVMTFANGAIAIATARRASLMGYDQRAEVVAANGFLVQADNIHANSVVRVQGDQRKLAKINYTFADRYADAYGNEVKHFADILLSGVAPRSTYGQCKEVAVLCDDALRSAEQGKAIVYQV